MLRTCRAYDASDETVVLGNERRFWRYDRELYRLAGIGALTDAIFDFAHALSKLHLDGVEFALLTAITIFSGSSFSLDIASRNNYRSHLLC
jgi:hypothetical protein